MKTKDMEMRSRHWHVRQGVIRSVSGRREDKKRKGKREREGDKTTLHTYGKSKVSRSLRDRVQCVLMEINFSYLSVNHSDWAGIIFAHHMAWTETGLKTWTLFTVDTLKPL